MDLRNDNAIAHLFDTEEAPETARRVDDGYDFIVHGEDSPDTG